jgi:hypothetical protein
MTLLSNLFLVATLAVFSLASCAGESPCEGDTCATDPAAESAPDLIRVEIEVAGDGTVFVDGPESLRCTGDQGLCSFSFARGSEVVISASAAFAGDSDLQDACVGKTECAFTLLRDEIVIANFDDDMQGEPGADNIIIDPIPTWYRSYAQQSIDQPVDMGTN